MEGGHILVINAGSSSLRFAVFTADKALTRLRSGKFERIGSSEGKVTVKGPNGSDQQRFHAPNHQQCAPHLLKLAEVQNGAALKAIGHRVVHGGPDLFEPTRVDATVLDQLRRISPFDPEHMPAEIALIVELRGRFANVPQIACFDTAFHRSMPRVAKLLPIPRRYADKGVQRYGFHGLSYAFLMQELERLDGREAANGRVILAHLGNGASMAAVRDGKCIDTTMAFTPTSGLVMSSRSGDLDPGLVAYLSRSEGMSVEQFHKMVNSKSGLLGISETSSDIRELLEREKEDGRAAEALALFCYQAKKWIGAMAAALGGVDTLVFAGGIGENNAVIRARICHRLSHLGIELDNVRNDKHEAVISMAGGTTVRVIPTDEEKLIAKAAWELVK